MARLLTVLDAPQGQTRFVGGCIRDSLLDLPVSDVDLATRLQPDQVMQKLARAKIRAVPTGMAHGTVTAVLDSGPVEVTTLRRDVATDGRRATVAFTADWKEDASRRDFTINAFSADPETGEIFDYFGGEADLKDRRLRFIGNPLNRIAEDHLRILRFFRFHARFGKGEPDAAALDACTRRANDLMALSRERIADELLKLLALADPAPTLALMVECGIFAPVLPEFTREGVSRLATLIAREQHAGEPPEALRRLAALLPPDPAIVSSVAARLRLSNKAAKRLLAAAGRTEQAPEDPKALAYSLGAEEAVDRLLLSSDAPAAVAQKVAVLRAWQVPRFPLSGGEIIAMGLPPGPVVARTLQAVEREWVEKGFPANPDQVRALARAHVDQALREGR
jgi:poly(A) polymerase